MRSDCKVEGTLCFECCKVLTISANKSLRDNIKYVRRYGYPDDWLAEHKVPHLLREISKRRAKKINPRLVKKIGNRQSYFLCKNFTGSGCSDYENRPYMCREYPLYGQSTDQWVTSSNYKLGGLYHIDCTYYEGDES